MSKSQQEFQNRSFSMSNKNKIEKKWKKSKWMCSQFDNSASERMEMEKQHEN